MAQLYAGPNSYTRGMTDSVSRSVFLPNFCRIRVLFAWVLTAELLAAVLALADTHADVWQALSLRSLYVQWIALSLAALLCLLRPWLIGRTHIVAGLLVWALGLLVTTLVFVLAQHYTAAAIDWTRLPAHLGVAAIVLAVALRYLFEMYRRRERELAEADARAQALQARIRPHFLFNSMNTIANLTRSDARLAEDVVQDLSDLFRASLGKSARVNTLYDELNLAKGYLRIEAQRLGERLQVEWDIAELPMAARLPALLLQPLLENAVYHGIEPALEGGTIEVVGRYRRGLVNIGIVNSVPADAPPQPRKGNQMAQQNVRDRLQAAFGERGEMRIGEVDGRYQVRIVFPFESELA